MDHPREGRFRTFRQTSVVEAADVMVWRRITDFEGINHELMPFMRMRVPAAYRGASIDSVPLGVPLGKVWIFYGGLLPLDYDALTLAEVEPNSHFQEVSTMLAMRRWEHRRELRALGADRTEVTDIVGFELRLPVGGALVEPALRWLFRHRHRRLARHFDARG